MPNLNKSKVEKFKGGFFGKKPKKREEEGKEGKDSTLKILDYLQANMPDEEEDEFYARR